MADEIKYEHKTVQTVRGTDSLVISKMQKDGWELAGQEQGMLRSTLTFRRPKKPLPRLLIASVIGGVAILAITIGVAAAFEDGDEKKSEPNASDTATGSTKPSAPSASATSESAADDVITLENNPEFAALLKTPDHCDGTNRDFATTYKGRVVAFDGSIVHVAPHGEYDTRYDFLLGPGDEGPRTVIGPAFKYEDVGISELRLTGSDKPAAVRAGDRFHFTAEVGEFNARQCLFFLDPVSTGTR